MTRISPDPFSDWRRIIRPVMALVMIVFATGMAQPARAAKVLALVNDLPVTDFDVSQRRKLNAIVGGGTSRKAALRAVINAAVMETEARKRNITVTDAQVEKSLQRMAKNMGGMAKMKAVLRRRGVRMRTMRAYVRASLLFSLLARRMGKNLSVKVSKEEVDRRYRKIMNDPRMRPVTIYNLREILLPVENVAPAMRQQLQYARVVEARQIVRRYRGCSSLRRAAAGVFNVRISKTLPADPRRLSRELLAALRKAGTKHLIGPIVTRKGIQLIAFCGVRRIAPPKPKRDQVERMVRAELFNREVERIMRDLRKKAYIDYKDKSAVIN